MIVDLPKGRFRLTFEERPNAPIFGQESSLSSALPVPPTKLLDAAPYRATKLSLLQLVAGIMAVVLLVGLGYLLGHSTALQQNAADQDLETLWAPFLSRKAAVNSFDRRSSLCGDPLESRGVRS